MSILPIILLAAAITTLIAVLYAICRIIWIGHCFDHLECIVIDYYLSNETAPELNIGSAFRDANDITNAFYRWDKWYILKDKEIIQALKEHEKVMKERRNDTTI